jgi:hypothetical protein
MRDASVLFVRFDTNNAAQTARENQTSLFGRFVRTKCSLPEDRLRMTYRRRSMRERFPPAAGSMVRAVR